MRLPVEILVVVCLLVGIIPAITIGPYLRTAAVSVLGADTPAYSLAVWHGINLPLVMSLIALVGGTLLYVALAGPITRGPEGPPLFRALKGQRIFERLLVTVSWVWARSLYRWLGTERLQWQLRILVLVALGSAAWLLWGAGRLRPAAPPGFDPLFAMLWAVGAACAVMAAWQAKYHRFAALVLVGGAGLVTCISFVWLSAPDLAVTQILVEIVTTVLLLLGLRWLPKRREEIAGDRTAARARPPRRRPRHRRRLRPRHRRRRLRGDDRAARPRRRRPGSSSTPTPRAAAPTSSTSSSSTSAASTPSARSPCSASSR